MKKILSLLILTATLLSVLSLSGCELLQGGDTTYVQRENGEKVEVLELVQTAEKNESFLDTEVSWYDDAFNYHAFYIGKIKNVPLTQTYSVFSYDGATLTYEREITKATESSIENATSQAVTNTVSTQKTNTFTIKGSLSGSIKNKVKASVSAGYTTSTTNTTTEENVWEESYRECVSQSESETNKIKITFDKTCQTGNYLYLYLGTVKVYYVVLQSRENPEEYYVEIYNSIESHRYALIYTGTDDTFPIDEESKIEIDPSFIPNLEEPTEYIEGLLPKDLLEPVEKSNYSSNAKTYGPFEGFGWQLQIDDIQKYYNAGYNKIEVSYEFYAVAQWGLLYANTMSIDGHLSTNRSKESGFLSFDEKVSTDGTWVRGSIKTDLKWFLENEAIYLTVYNKAVYGSNRDLTVNKITISYKITAE